MTDLVVISLESWDGVWRRNQHLLWRMLQADPALRVLFVEPAADPTHALRSGRRPSLGRGPDDAHLPGRLWTMRATKLLPRRIDTQADRRIARRIARAARELEMTEPILWVNDPGGAEVSRLTGWRTLYDMTDDWLAADRPDAELVRVGDQERFLLSEAEQVVACSPELQRRKSGQRPPQREPIALVRNAVDTAAYRVAHSRPADLPDGAVAVYVGTLHADRLDVALCEDIATRLKGTATLVLVGPDALSDTARAGLRAAGVMVLGARTHQEVIGYLQHADALVVPHVVTSFTDSLDPIKLYEYQAAGRQVVSTAVAGFRDADDDRIAIAAVGAFPDAVLTALAKSEPFRAHAGPDVADWDERADETLSILRRMVR